MKLFVIVDGDKIDVNHPDIEFVRIEQNVNGTDFITFKYRGNERVSMIHKETP